MGRPRLASLLVLPKEGSTQEGHLHDLCRVCEVELGFSVPLLSAGSGGHWLGLNSSPRCN